MQETTAKLTAAMAAGEEEAVEVFYRHYFDWMFGQARRASRRDEAFCLDVVQDAVMRVMRTVREVKSEGQFRAWLKLVVQTTALDRLRSEDRRKYREMVTSRGEEQGGAERFDGEQAEWLRREIAELDPELGRLIEMRFGEGLTLGRIAAAMGLTVGTIDGRLRRALIGLRLKAGEEFDV